MTKAIYLSHDGLATSCPKAPGEFRFEDLGYSAAPPPNPGETGRLSFGCPLGRGHCGSILIGNGVKPSMSAPSWQWDGNVEKPTLTPSINCRGCGWHAYLTAGEFK